MEELVYVGASDKLPTEDEMSAMPDERRALLEELGMTALSQIEGQANSEIGRPLNPADAKLYREYFSYQIPRNQYVGTIPNGSLHAIRNAVRTEVYADVVLRQAPDGETIAIGSIKPAKGVKIDCLLAQWGEKLTRLPELQSYQDQAKARRLAAKKEERREQFRRNLLGSLVDLAGPAIALAGVGMFIMFVLVLGWNWWLLGVALALALSWWYVSDGMMDYNDFTAFTSTVLTLSVIGFGINALVDAESSDKHKDVLVCGVSHHKYADYSTKPEDWWITTPQGWFDLQDGVYNNTFYHKGRANKALTVGMSYRITYHGGVFVMAPYVTKAEVLNKSLGKCSK